MSFYDVLVDVLNEKGKTIQDLERDKVLPKNVFYNFKFFTPSLKHMISMANYLELSLDYIVGNSSENKFKKYKLSQNNFFKILSEILKENSVSQSKLSKDTGIARVNFSRWKGGLTPQFSSVLLISKYLKCNIDELLERE